MSNLKPAEIVRAFSAGANIEQIRDDVQELGKADPEAGHILIDGLMVDAFKAVRDGHHNPAKLASDLLTINEASFDRWYA